MRPLCRTNDQTMALLRGFSRAGIHRLLDTGLLQDHVFSSLHHLTGIHEYLFEYQYLSDLCVIILIHHPSSSMLKINVPFSFNVGTFRAGELVFLTALNPSSVFLHTPVQPNPTRAQSTICVRLWVKQWVRAWFYPLINIGNNTTPGSIDALLQGKVGVMLDMHLDCVVVGLAGLSVCLVGHEPGLQQVLIETVSKTPHRCVIWRERWRERQGSQIKMSQ